MSDSAKRPVLIVLTSHWVSMLGVFLVTLAGFSWLFVLPANLRGGISNPYLGLLAFVAIPIVFFAGLVLIPIGIALGRKKLTAELDAIPDRRDLWRRAGLFFGLMTLANLVIGSQLSYRAVEQMDTVQFCGQTCHVMKPEFTAHGLPPHRQVACASCHIAPGAEGFVRAKMNGTRQLIEVTFNTFPRPIEPALASNRLVSSAETCEQCHSRQRVTGPMLKIVNKYKDDEANTPTKTVLMMMVGGGRTGGIHGVHLGPGVHIRYAASDNKRQTIPWVEYQNTESRETRTYVAAGTNPNDVKSLPVFEMQCVDCHNRASHSFEQPDAAVDRFIANGQIATSLPFVKKTGLALVKATYPSSDEAAQKIKDGVIQFYRQSYPAVASQHAAEIESAARALTAAYQDNNFPDLKVAWGTYPNNLGHTDFPGCFRCHDDSHANSDKKTITQDCNTCHQALAVEETSPAVLETLGLGSKK